MLRLIKCKNINLEAVSIHSCACFCFASVCYKCYILTLKNETFCVVMIQILLFVFVTLKLYDIVTLFCVCACATTYTHSCTTHLHWQWCAMRRALLKSEFMLQWLTSKSDGMSLANSRSKHCKIISAAKYVICMRNYVMHSSRMSARARTCSARSSVFETTPIT